MHRLICYHKYVDRISLAPQINPYYYLLIDQHLSNAISDFFFWFFAYYYYYYKLIQSPNGERIAISPKTQWGSESTVEKVIIDKKLKS